MSTRLRRRPGLSNSGASGAGRVGGTLRSVRVMAFTAATTLSAVIYFNTHVAEITPVRGPSMAPFFNTDYDRSLTRDVVLVRRWQPWQGVRRGSVVTFWSPNNPENMAIKRVIALEGDEVRTRPPYPHPTVVVPRGHVWVEGDTVEDRKTFDSNSYGPISASLIVGHAVAVVYPFKKAGWFRPEHYRESSRVWKNKEPIVHADDLDDVV